MPDTDGDGTNDGPEAAQGGNPKNPADGGQPPPPDTVVTLKLWLGAGQTAAGEPGSYHEDDFQAYRMKIYEKNPDGTGQAAPLYDYASNGTFVNGPTEFKFQKTKSYTVKIYTATNSPAGQPNKDFDYTALIKGCVVTDDPHGILGDHEQDQEQGKPFPQRGKKATLTVPKIEFKPLSPNSGFDDTTNPHWLMAPENGSNYAKAVITPASVANKINFVIRPDSSQEIVTPATATTSPQTVTVNGIERGEGSWGEARCEGQTEACTRFNIVVKGYKSYSINYHAITEENDDVALNNQGPNQPYITPGPNGFLDSIRGGDDQIVNGNITTGANGIKESTLKNTNLVPLAAPNAAAIQVKLNEIFGLQANVYFTMEQHDRALNYDLDRSGKLDISASLTPPSTEEEVVRLGDNDGNFSFNLYHVKDFLDPIIPLAAGASRGSGLYAVFKDGANRVYVACHEIGHLWELKHADIHVPGFVTDPHIDTRLMSQDMGGSPASRLIKYEWDTVNPPPQP